MMLPMFFAMLISSCSLSSHVSIEDPGEDTAIYSNDYTHAKLDNPDISNYRASENNDDDEGEEPTSTGEGKTMICNSLINCVLI